jgi:glycosyltransferase involved in cell wall biosynthesis
MSACSVSVVIPAHRAACTIARALASVAAQSLKPLEVIVVDDGSTDGTLDAAEAMRARLAPIELVLISQENLGAGAARNSGVRAARGEWLAFLDADDEWLPEKLARSLDHAKDATLIAHDFLEVRDGVETLMESSRHALQTQDIFQALMLRGFIPSITVLARRSAVLTVGGFDESLPAAQDYDLWLRLLSLPESKLVMFPEALSRYYVSNEGITSKIDQRRRCSLAVLAKHASRLRRNALKTVMLRGLIIQWEAISAFAARRDFLGAVGTLLLTPLVLAEGLFLLYGTLFALVWGVILFVSYHVASGGYYAEKIAAFGSFLLKRLTGA